MEDFLHLELLDLGGRLPLHLTQRDGQGTGSVPHLIMASMTSHDQPRISASFINIAS